MGLFDYIQIEDGLDTTLPGFDGDPTRLDWQTKTFKHPLMDVYKITMNGRLFKEDAHYESVPDEDRPSDGEEQGGYEEGWQQGWERKQKIHDGWTDTEYHGRLEFHHYSAEPWYSEPSNSLHRGRFQFIMKSSACVRTTGRRRRG